MQVAKLRPPIDLPFVHTYVALGFPMGCTILCSPGPIDRSLCPIDHHVQQHALLPSFFIVQSHQTVSKLEEYVGI